MIKHYCFGETSTAIGPKLVYFTDPGEPISPHVGAVIYQRHSFADTMQCPMCGYTVPYKIQKSSAPVLTADVPVFLDIISDAAKSGDIIEIPEPLD